MLLFSCKYAAGMLKTSDIGRFFRIIEKEMDKVKICLKRSADISRTLRTEAFYVYRRTAL